MTNILALRKAKDARQTEDDLTLWRDYRAYLQARLLQVRARIAEMEPAFERDAEQELALKRAETTLATLARPQRALFDAVVTQQIEQERRRTKQDARSGWADPDEQEIKTLTLLLGQANGDAQVANAPGFGHFPRGTADDITWYAIDISIASAAPDEAAYTAHQEEDEKARALKQMGIAAAVLVGFLVLWILWPSGAADTTPRAIGALPRVNGAELAPWPVQSLQLVASDGQTQTLAVDTTTELAGWPATTSAVWRSLALAPLQLCVANRPAGALTAIELISSGSIPRRRYQLQPEQPARADLIVTDCATKPTHAPLYGTLIETLAPLSYEVGQAATLPSGATVTLQTASMHGPATDPLLPEGQAAVVVEVAAPQALDWTALSPQLLLTDGSRILPSERQSSAAGVQLRYLVPLPQAELDLVWELIPPETGQALRWRTQVPAPLTRAQTLDAALLLGSITVSQVDQQLMLDCTLTNQSRQPLQLVAQDFGLIHRGQPLALPAFAGLDQPLASGETRALRIPIPSASLQLPLTLTVGGLSILIEQP